ncbi:MAG: cytochrome c/FTR1 family iron permease [Archangium sp.]|nr:cytochrome c/FTR1 family iron permease [Archangium sp.]
MRRALVMTVLAVSAGARAESAEWHRVVALLQYLEGDYAAAVAEQNADELAEQRGLADEAVTALTELGPAGAPFLERAKQLQADIGAGRAAEGVIAGCHALVHDIVSSQGLSRAPRVTPDLAAGQALFTAQCSSCHGLEGKGDGPAAKGLTPAPANFHDAARMQTLTPYKVFNTTTFGIKGTPMPGFPALSEVERWSVAFFVFTLRQPACHAQPGLEPELEVLATSTDVQLAQRLGADGVSCARRVMPQTDESSALAVARAGLEQARTFARAGQWDDARKAVVDAYLLGLEPIEPTLRARDPQLVDALEQGFTRARLAAQRRDGFDAQVDSLLAQLSPQNTPSKGDFWSVFFASLIILLREGFEATIVVGALLAVMKKMGATAQVRVVHAGWVSALVFGVVAFVFGQSVLAGANREWLETVVALFAVGLLLYAALWLNARVNISAFMGELRGKMKDALGSGSAIGLFTISFTSVGRETVETALFLQGLAGDSPEGVWWGALAGGAALVVLVVFVRTVGFKLPMKALFNASTVLLVATAVMLLGKGLHGLQELGVLPLSPLPLFTIDALGIYPDALTLVPQGVLAAAPLLWWAFTRQRPASPIPPGAESAR